MAAGLPLPHWPDEGYESRAAFYGIRTSALIANEPRWIHRRVERLELIDETRARRHMSVDFTLPDLPAAEWDPTPELQWLIPVALLQKRPMIDLDVRDAAGDALSVLTREQNSAIACELLTSQARETLVELLGPGAALEQPLLSELADIAGARRGHDDRPSDRTRGNRTSDAIQGFRGAAIRAARSPTGLADPLDRQRELLWRDETMRGFMTILAERFLLLVPVTAAPGARRIIKVGWEQVLETLDVALATNPNRGQVLREFMKSSCGFRTYPVRIDTRSVFGPESYHVEIVAPDELVVEFARLERFRTVTDLATGRVTSTRVSVWEDRGTERAHLYESFFAGGLDPGGPPAANEEVGARSTISVGFFIRPSFVRPPLLIGLVTCGMLAAGLLLKAAHIPRIGDVAALIVVLPAIFAAYLIPGEHRMVRRMFQGLRLLVLALAVTSFAAAATLTLRFSSRTLVIIWLALFGTAAGCTAMIAYAFRVSSGKMATRPSIGLNSVRWISNTLGRWALWAQHQAGEILLKPWKQLEARFQEARSAATREILRRRTRLQARLRTQWIQARLRGRLTQVKEIFRRRR